MMEKQREGWCAPQDLRSDQHRLPALPRSQFVIKVLGHRT
jgi:hypothetical protein